MKTITSLIVGSALFFGVSPSFNLNAQHPEGIHEQHGREATKKHGNEAMQHHAQVKEFLLAKGATEAQLEQAHELIFELRIAMVDVKAKVQKATIVVQYLTHKKGSKIQDVEAAIDALFAAKASAHKLHVRGLFQMREIFGEKTWAAVSPLLLSLLHGMDDDHDEDGCDHDEDDEDDDEDDDDDDDDEDDDDEDDDDDEENKKNDHGKRSHR